MFDNTLPELSPQTRELIAQVEAAAPRLTTDEFTRYAEGLFYAAACTSLTDEEATARMNEVPSGTSGGWTLSTDAKFDDGTPHPAPCPDKPNTHRHLLFEA